METWTIFMHKKFPNETVAKIFTIYKNAKNPR